MIINMQGKTYYVIMDAYFYTVASEPGDGLAFMSVEQLQECKSALEDAKAHIWNNYDKFPPDPQSSAPLSQAPKFHLSVGATEAQARDVLDDRIKRVEQALTDRKES
jgi:hypothetical protein